MTGLDVLEARGLRLSFDRHFHDTYSFGLVSEGVERCGVGRLVHFYEPGTVPMFNPGEVHDGAPATYGLTPHRYQQSRRMAHARRLICAGTPLPEIAAACGYADQSHLNRWFLRVYGTTPGRFRRAFFS